LEGYAYDPEDGVLDGASIEWNSDIDGALGTGKTITPSLSRGRHQIVMTALDKDGNKATQSVSLTIGFSMYLPLLKR
jgi:hypothetical protein